MDKEKNNNLTLFLRHYHPTRGMRLYITSGVQTLPYLQTIAICRTHVIYKQLRAVNLHLVSLNSR